MKSAYFFGAADAESDKSASLTLPLAALSRSNVCPSRRRACFAIAAHTLAELDFPTKWTSPLVVTIDCVRDRIGVLIPSCIILRHGIQFFPATDNVLYDVLSLVAIFVKPPMALRKDEDIVHTDALFEHHVRDNPRRIRTIEFAKWVGRIAAEVLRCGADGQRICRMRGQDPGKVAVIRVRIFVEVAWEATAIEDIPNASEVAVEAAVYAAVVPGLPLLAHLCCRHCGSCRCIEISLRAVVCSKLLGPLSYGCVARLLPIIGGVLTAPSTKVALAREGLAINAPPARNVSTVRETMRMAEYVSADSAPVRVVCLVQLCDVRLVLRELWTANSEAARIPRLQQSHHTSLPPIGRRREGTNPIHSGTCAIGLPTMLRPRLLYRS